MPNTLHSSSTAAIAVADLEASTTFQP